MKPTQTTAPRSSGPATRGADIRAAVSMLARDLGAEAVKELAQAFFVDTPGRLAELMSLAGGSDQATLRRAAHSLKGSAALFGATRLEEAAARLEDFAAREMREPQLEEARRIQMLYVETRNVMEALLDDIAVH